MAGFIIMDEIRVADEKPFRRFLDTVRFVIDGGAVIGRKRFSDAFDLAENPDMVEPIGEEVAKRGIDLEVARHPEKNAMLSDALEMLHNDDPSKLWPTHPANGATPLHVASAKGYKVMNILLQAGHPVDSQDLDGWTPLHAAAHWGEKQACETLVEHMARMDVRNKDGHTCFDLADEKVLPVLKELEAKQAERKKENVPIIHHNNEVFVRPSAPSKEIPQIFLLSSSGSVEAKETPMEVTKLPEIRRISPPPQEKSDVSSTVPPPLPVSPVPEDLGSVKPEKRPSAESEDKPRKRPDLLVTSASSIAPAKTAVTTSLSPTTTTTASVAQPATAAKTTVAAPIRPSPFSTRTRIPSGRLTNPTVSSTTRKSRVTSTVGASGTTVTPSTTPEPHNKASSGDLSIMARKRSSANRPFSMLEDIQEMGDPHEDQENTKDVGTPYSGDDLQTKPEKIQSHSSIVTTVTSTKPTLAPTSSSDVEWKEKVARVERFGVLNKYHKPRTSLAPSIASSKTAKWPTSLRPTTTAASVAQLATAVKTAVAAPIRPLPYHSSRLSSQPSSRNSSLNSVNTGSTSGAEKDPIDYKKLYEEEKREAQEAVRAMLQANRNCLYFMDSRDKERRRHKLRVAELQEKVRLNTGGGGGGQPQVGGVRGRLPSPSG